MPFCKKCGKELGATQAYCDSCGTKTDGTDLNGIVNTAKDGAISLYKTATTEIKKLKIADNFNKLGKNKLLFVLSFVGLLLCIFLQFSGLLNYLEYFNTDAVSLIKVFDTFYTWSSFYEDAEIIFSALKTILNISIILLAAATVLMILPLLLNKPYKKSSFILPKISVVYTFICYFCAFAFLLTNEYAKEIFAITFFGILFFIVMIATLVILNILSKRIKKSAKFETEENI